MNNKYLFKYAVLVPALFINGCFASFVMPVIPAKISSIDESMVRVQGNSTTSVESIKSEAIRGCNIYNKVPVYVSNSATSAVVPAPTVTSNYNTHYDPSVGHYATTNTNQASGGNTSNYSTHYDPSVGHYATTSTSQTSINIPFFNIQRTEIHEYLFACVTQEEANRIQSNQ